jgi:methionyl-tRNA formyltransferase
MDEGLDTGEIHATRMIALQNSDTSATLSDKLSILGIDALIEVCDKIQDGTSSSYPQAEHGKCYAHKISKQEANIDWRNSSVVLERAIRALNPDPVCFTFLDQLRIKLFKAVVSCSDGNQGSPGEILGISKSGIEVACGEGSLLLEQIQLPIGKGSILTGADVLNARSDMIFTGAIFDKGAILDKGAAAMPPVTQI